ncbi:alpha/beta hydrolase [Skermanella rosea]|uniref:alpha/beta fold hydrolase n=1 Tax=Skermanella rosea TaxID=1817965 RepID=UPI001932C94D|nr:alpha/beta hydrolase [Skermanella rosea]UEM04373.1 alpha/beta hydrolase [Skermanella rosea]
MHSRMWTDNPAGRIRPPIVLVHGLGLSSRYMVPLGRRLAAIGHDVLAPDLPGFGRSPIPAGARWPAGPDVLEQAEQLIAWMDACGVDKAVLFGNSIGVQVAVEVAVRFPDRVDRLVLAGPTPDPAYRTPMKQYPRVVMNMPFETPSLNSLFQVEYASAGIPRMAQQLRRTVDDPIEKRLPKVRASALVIRGQYDQTLSQPWAEDFTRLLPDGRLVVVEGAAHNVHYTAAYVTARLIHSFLDGELDGRPAAESNRIVVPGSDYEHDPLAPPQPISTRTHGMLDYATAALCLALPHALACGPRTRKLLTLTAMSASAYSLFTDYELGAVRKIPMTVHLNIDASSGMELLLASATRLRKEPAAGRWAVAALGAFHLFAVAATRLPMGPARLVRVRDREVPALAPAPAARQAAASQADRLDELAR